MRHYTNPNAQGKTKLPANNLLKTPEPESEFLPGKIILKSLPDINIKI